MIHVSDVSGETADAEHQLYKTRLDKDGNSLETEKVEKLNLEKKNVMDVMICYPVDFWSHQIVSAKKNKIVLSILP